MDKFEDYKDIDEESLDEEQLYLMSLINRAHKEEYSEFALISDLAEFRKLRFKLKEAKFARKHFSQAATTLYNAYVNSLKDGVDDMMTLIAVRNCEDLVSFWEKEQEILKDIKSEYISYIFMGHVLDTICGKTRDEEDMFDYRKIGINHDDRNEE